MATANTDAVPKVLSIEQYLNTTYRPDVDFVDGLIEERNLGETGPAKLQTRLSFLFSLNEEAWGIEVMTEVRVQVSPTRFRIPDVCVVREGGADERIVTEPPLLCLEVLSPSDSFKAMRRRVDDFFTMGVPEVWIFDPETSIVYICTASTTTERTEGVLRLHGTEIEVSLEEAFKSLKLKA